MIDLKLFRAKIGCYNLIKIYSCKKKPSLGHSSYHGAQLRMLLTILVVGVVGVVLLGYNTHLFSSETKYYNHLETRQGSDTGFKLSVSLFSSKIWNAFMRATNGNTKNSINIAH